MKNAIGASITTLALVLLCGVGVYKNWPRSQPKPSAQSAEVTVTSGNNQFLPTATFHYSRECDVVIESRPFVCFKATDGNGKPLKLTQHQWDDVAKALGQTPRPMSEKYLADQIMDERGAQ